MQALRSFVNICERPFFTKILRASNNNVNLIRRRFLSTVEEQQGTAGLESVEVLKKELAEKEKSLKEIKDSYLLSLADMENLRQRTKRDIEASSQFAIQRFAKDLIPVIDILEVALSSKSTASSEKQLADLMTGLGMTVSELQRALSKHGVTAVDPLNQKFDPNVHNALFEVPYGDVEPGTVVNVQKKGYMLHHRCLRPADVGVSRKP